MLYCTAHYDTSGCGITIANLLKKSLLSKPTSLNSQTVTYTAGKYIDGNMLVS